MNNDANNRVIQNQNPFWNNHANNRGIQNQNPFGNNDAIDNVLLPHHGYDNNPNANNRPQNQVRIPNQQVQQILPEPNNQEIPWWSPLTRTTQRQIKHVKFFACVKEADGSILRIAF